ncbi:sigma-70 family RNA polymerase sigma factor [Pseudomonas sp. GM17]|uniref:RNA polymerase sigma factor n=1 Tax=Pseudomonas sp. GM17 TaxID=1144323 RepID=UPI00027256AE|nr:sigma-70 family RNA polymerase sigma factor [Pseudomonas sp. GM17]WIE50850.1 sigma-70 family RNA polymerase sigma factor [Pseudomonas sp. GM17]
MGSFREVAVADQLFEASWQAVYPELMRRANRRARGNLALAQEWISNTAIKALLFFRRSPERIREPQGFLFLVLDHVFLDSLRTSKREEQLFDRSIDLAHDHQALLAAPCVSVFEHTEQFERLMQLGRRVEQLPLPQRRLFEMRFVEELPYPQIAAELGIAQPLARKRVQLLRAALR